jgi:protein subunit release factor B
MPPIRPEKIQELQQKLESLGIFEADLTEKFILGSGRGGQKIQKTSSTVFLHHIPSGIIIKCQKGRSRELNRYYARKLLIEKFEEKILKIKTEKEQAFEKIRRQKRKRSKKAKEKMLQDKKERGEIKQSRAKPDEIS